MPIQVKVLCKGDARQLARQLPGDGSRWGDCEFQFDPLLRRYDWLMVYEDLATRRDAGGRVEGERLACPSAHTLLVTTEPSSIKTYGSDFVGQFGHVLTSQAEWALPHPHRIHSQPGLRWFYGVGGDRPVVYDELAAAQPAKSKTIATVCSNKRQRHTLHNRRYQFIQRLQQAIPELEVFGHGVRRMDDKRQALDAYQYHVAIENFRGPHHWTEKLADAFLGFTLPFYFGCPNVADYFPEESFIPIDILDFESSRETIERAICDDAYQRRLPAVLEARRRVLQQYNLFAVAAELVTRFDGADHTPVARRPGIVYPRTTITRDSCLGAARLLCEKVQSRFNRYRAA